MSKRKLVFMSDIHQSEVYEDVIAGIDPEARLLVICGDWLQCHKDIRPSKGKIKGLPGVDNGFGETVQNWALEAAAYINHGTPIPKGQAVDFRTIPSGTLRIDTKNYDEMYRFMQTVVDDTKNRIERIHKILDIKHRQTGIETVMFPGHDAAYDLWISELFPEIKTLSKTVYDCINSSGFWKLFHKPHLQYKTETTCPNLYLSRDIPFLTLSPLFPLPDTARMLRNFVGYDQESVAVSELRDKANYLENAMELGKFYEWMLGSSPFFVLASHEGPKEVSDIVLGTEGEEGKTTENRQFYERIFANPNQTDTKVIWVYGNDGLPIPVTKDIRYGAGNQLVTVHHLAELDVKGDPMSRKGGVSYIDMETGKITAPNG